MSRLDKVEQASTVPTMQSFRLALGWTWANLPIHGSIFEWVYSMKIAVEREHLLDSLDR